MSTGVNSSRLHNRRHPVRLCVLLAATLTAAVAVAGAPPQVVHAAPNDPFDATKPQVFISQNTPTILRRASTTGNGTWSFTDEGPVSAKAYNALGYNLTDSYLYAIESDFSPGTPNRGYVLKIGTTGVATRVVDNPLNRIKPGTNINVGAFVPSGNELYVMASGQGTTGKEITVVNVTTATVVRPIILSMAPEISDMSYADGYFWGMYEHSGATGGTIVRIDPTLGVTNNVTLFPTGLSIPFGVYGAVWTFGNGNLAFSNNTSGRVYQVDITNPGQATPSFTLIADSAGPGSTQNDGAAIPGATDLAITKSGPASLSASASPVAYTIVVTNNGPQQSTGWFVDDLLSSDLTNVTVGVPPAAGTCSITGQNLHCSGGTLAIGASVTITVNATATPSSTCIANTAQVFGNEDETNNLNNQATTTACVPGPAISLTKTASQSTFIGTQEIITYTFTATNTGAVRVSTSITDPMIGLSPLSCNLAQPAMLNPGAVQKCTATKTTNLTDVNNRRIDNTATVTATDALNRTVTARASAVVTLVDTNPAISLTKTPDVNEVRFVGDTITYQFVATNTGDVALDDVAIDDDLPGLSLLTCSAPPPVHLDPSEALTCSASYIVTAADLAAGSVDNTADASGTAPDESIVTDTASATVDANPPNPAISLTKTANQTTFIGTREVITYTFTATNTGPWRVTATITDPLIGLSPLSCNPAQPASLAPGATLVCTATKTTNLTDIANRRVANTATVSATDFLGRTVTARASAVVTLVDTNPAISLTKTTEVSEVQRAGDPITYDLVATNTGDVALSDVTITDDLPGLTLLSCSEPPPVQLQPNEALSCTASYTVTTADLAAGHVDNTAEASGSAPDESIVRDTDSATVAANPPNASISLTKTPDVDEVTEVGDVISYQFVATNTGDIDLDQVRIVDNRPGLTALECSEAQPLTLAPGESLMCTANYVVTSNDLAAGSVDNIATVSGVYFDDITVTATASASVDASIRASGISLTKTANRTNYHARGDTIEYTLVATNTGAVDLSGVAIADPMPGLSPLHCVPFAPATLHPGETITCTATYIVTADDLNLGSLVNRATATGYVSGGTPISASASAQVPRVFILLPTTGFDVRESVRLTLVALGAGGLLVLGARQRRRTAPRRS